MWFEIVLMTISANQASRGKWHSFEMQNENKFNNNDYKQRKTINYVIKSILHKRAQIYLRIYSIASPHSTTKHLLSQSELRNCSCFFLRFLLFLFSLVLTHIFPKIRIDLKPTRLRGSMNVNCLLFDLIWNIPYISFTPYTIPSYTSEIVISNVMLLLHRRKWEETQLQQKKWKNTNIE